MPLLAAMRFNLSRTASCAHGRCLGLWGVSVAFFHAAIEEDVFVRPPKNMRKDRAISKLKKVMYGTEVANSGWHKLVRETLCNGQCKVLTSVLCVASNQKEDSMVLFHGDDSLAEGHDSSLDKLDDVLGAFQTKRLPRIGSTTGREGVFLYSGTNLDPRIQIPSTWTPLVETLSLNDARPVATPFELYTGKRQNQHTVRVEPGWKGVYMTGPDLLQHNALDRMDVVFATKEVRSRTAKADMPALLFLKRLARYLVGRREIAMNYPYQDNPSQIDCNTDADCAGNVATRLSTTAGTLMHGAHWLAGCQ